MRRTREEVVLTEKRESCAELGQGKEERRELAAGFGRVQRLRPGPGLCLPRHLHLRERVDKHARRRDPAVLLTGKATGRRRQHGVLIPVIGERLLTPMSGFR